MPTEFPKRSRRYGVGKEIGGAVYVHRLYEARLGDVVSKAKQQLPADFTYDVVKYNSRTETVSFIKSIDFDTAPEPTVGDSLSVDLEGNVRRRSQSSDPEIYHHKWLFVVDEYEGFDIEESKRRSAALNAIDGVDRKRIGRKSYWSEHCIATITFP